MCTLSMKDPAGATYWMSGWASVCETIHSADGLIGHFEEASGITFFYLDLRYQDKKGRKVYSRPFTVTTKWQ
jgi:hypothetical protein